jgi:hypothetical protein
MREKSELLKSQIPRRGRCSAGYDYPDVRGDALATNRVPNFSSLTLQAPLVRVSCPSHIKKSH